ncbi:DUF1971 domain-containing protein [Nisaea acidiphila]|uniref:DUF1971 domain-containing protein n=1 Tax=Nisaea acidiphila TaxID=1862145 RepID=A0A9J7AZP5_9PROT|nr:DUF1971 domain-containing protein [Nisaea acidiphila]UUX51889.1 DUF1971 domain-containing protein [Nisaea acidiphila]
MSTGTGARPALPPGAQHYSSSPRFTEVTVPAKLTGLHRTKPGVWGRLVVEEGALTFIEPGPAEYTDRLAAGEVEVIAPERPHRVAVDGPVVFLVEFYRE